MGANSRIQWCDATFNPWRGCTKVSEGCKHCYAETLSARNPKVLGVWGPQGTRVMASEAMWREPMKWNEAAKEAGERHRVFCASLADVFEGPQTCSEEAYRVIVAARVRLFEVIAQTPNLDWLLLTKRAERILPTLKDIAGQCEHGPGRAGGLAAKFLNGTPPPNVWLGTSVENQDTADKRIPELLKVPAAIRFLSCEPLLGPVELPLRVCEHCGEHSRDGLACEHCDRTGLALPGGIYWVIVGGESGPRARPMHPDWPRSLRDQCQAAGVSFFFKQWGEWIEIPEAHMSVSTDPIPGTRVHEVKVVELRKGSGVKYAKMARVGKLAAGRLLDGKMWDEVPGQEVQGE